MHGWPQAPYERKAEVDANYTRMLEYGCRPEHARGGAPRRGQPQPLRHRLRLRPARSPRCRALGRVRDARGHGQPPGARGPRARRRPACSTRRSSRRRTSTAPSPTWSAGWTRTPRPRTSCATSSTSRPGSAGVDRRARSFPGRVRAPGRSLRRATAHAGSEQGSGRPRRSCRPPARSSRTSPTPTGRSPPTVPGSRTSLRRWSEHAPDAIPLQIGGRARARRRRAARSVIPSRPERVAYRFALAGRAEVDRALTVAAAAQPGWAAQPAGGAGGAAGGVRGGARPPARRSDRRDDARRRQDRDRGGRRGLRGGRLRAVLRPHPSRERRTSWTIAAAEPLGVVVVTPPWNFPLSIPAGGVLAALGRGQRRHAQAGAGGGARRLGAGQLPVERGRTEQRCCSSCRAPTTRSAAGSSPIRGWAASS